MKTLTIDKKWKVEIDNTCCTLINETDAKKINKETKKKEEYTKKESWYYPTIQHCLKKYLSESIKEETEVLAVLKRIDEVENNINKLKKLWKYQ